MGAGGDAVMCRWLARRRADEDVDEINHHHDCGYAGAQWGASELGIKRVSRLRSKMRGSGVSDSLQERGFGSLQRAPSDP
jgi:hypothetical protein